MLYSTGTDSGEPNVHDTDRIVPKPVYAGMDLRAYFYSHLDMPIFDGLVRLIDFMSRQYNVHLWTPDSVRLLFELSKTGDGNGAFVNALRAILRMWETQEHRLNINETLYTVERKLYTFALTEEQYGAVLRYSAAQKRSPSQTIGGMIEVALPMAEGENAPH